MATDPNARIAQDKRDRLKMLETPYLRAKGYEKSEQFTADRLVALETIRSIVRFGQISDSDALIALGRLQQVLLDAYRHEAVILEYEGIQKTLREMFPREKE